MATITLSTAACLTGLSKRTLWRRVTDGLLHLQGDATQGEHARVPLEEILPLSRLQLADSILHDQAVQRHDLAD